MSKVKFKINKEGQSAIKMMKLDPSLELTKARITLEMEPHEAFVQKSNGQNELIDSQNESELTIS